MAPSTKGIRPWSCEIASFEHRDVHSTVMGLSNNGSNIILGDRRSLFLIDLLGSGNVIRTIPRNSKWDVTKVAPNNGSVALSSNNSIDLLSSELKPQNKVLKAHQRLITDVNWKSPSDPNVFSSTSLDPDVHIWDARVLQSPQLTLNGVIGASQCKWNRVNPAVLATVHDGDVKLWDIRKKDYPFTYLTAHVSARILSFDWSFTHEHEFVTTGQQDQLIKFHCTQKTPESTKTSSFLKMAVPVWIARHTPFGEGLATIIIPHLHQNDNSLFLWNMNSLESPIHSFFGHRDVIYDFDWRKCPNNTNNLELVTWSRDRTVRIWQVDKTIQCQCGSEESDDVMDGVETHEPPPKVTEKVDLLKEEFDALEFNFSNIRLEEVNLNKRLIKLCVKDSAILIINFPSKYPSGGSSPTFVFLRNMGNAKTTLPSSLRQKILNALKIVAFKLAQSNKPCLEECLSHLDSLLSQEASHLLKEGGESIRRPMDSFPAADNRNISRKKEPVYFEGDGNVPYPRSSGAVFCGNGTLVVFGNKLFSHSGITPRALSAYGAQLKDLLRMDNFENSVVVNTKTNENDKTSGDLPINKGRFNIKTVKSSSPGRDKGGRAKTSSGTLSGSNTLKRRKMLMNQTKVSLYNVSGLFPFSKYFASTYLFNPSNDISLSDICNINAKLAKKAAREDLVRLWMLANQMASLSKCQELHFWEHHPLGRPLLTSIIQHYIDAKDPQTAATLILAFQNDEDLTLPLAKNRSANNSVKFYFEANLKDTRDEAETSSNNVHVSASSLESSAKEGSSSKQKFWFLKPGALNSLAASTSPYHTVTAVTNSSLILKDSPVISKSTFKRDTTVSNLDLALWNPNKSRSNSWCSSAILAPYSQHKMKKNSSLRHMTPPNRHLRLSSPSFSSSAQFVPLSEEEDVVEYEKKPPKETRGSLLDPRQSDLYHKVKVTYGDILYNWGLFSKRAEVLKRCVDDQLQGEEVANVFAPVVVEDSAGGEGRNMMCALCQLPVKGLASSCLICGHGGHSQHLMQWFITPDTKCPTGCGCQCQNQSGESLYT